MLRANELGRQLGVSKTPVHEALRKLQAEDLLAVASGNALTAKVMSEKRLLETRYTREALEGMAARLATETAGWIDLTPKVVLRDLENAHAQSNLAAISAVQQRIPARRVQSGSQRHDLRSKTLRARIGNSWVTTMSVPGHGKEVRPTRPSGLPAPTGTARWNSARDDARRSVPQPGS